MATNVAQDRLGDLFVREGLITEEQLADGLKESRESKTRLGFSLVKLGFVAEEELTKMLAKQYRVPAVDLERVEVDPKIIKLVPSEVARKHMVLPLPWATHGCDANFVGPSGQLSTWAIERFVRHVLDDRKN